MPAKLVSIILPTYNRRALLQEAIASIQTQTWTAWELIVVDDGSTDGTPEHVPPDSRIHIVARPHTGNVAALRNLGLERARGDMIAFQDSDDRWHPDKLAVQIARLNERLECGWCYGRHGLINVEGHPIPEISSFPWEPREGRFLREVISTEAGVSLLTVLVRRRLALTLRFDETIPWGDDYDFLVRLALTAPACVVDRYVADVREHPGRGNHHRYDQMLNFAVAYHRYERLVNEPDLKRLCRRRAYACLRDYLANARAAGALGSGLKSAAAAWWRDYRRTRRDRASLDGLGTA